MLTSRFPAGYDHTIRYVMSACVALAFAPHFTVLHCTWFSGLIEMEVRWGELGLCDAFGIAVAV